jgi:hypothetical protein
MGYGGKTVEQVRSRELRADGWTVPEIADHLGVARSSVSLWVRDVPYVPRRPRPPRSTPNRLQLAKRAEIEQLKAWGVAQVGEVTDRDLLIAGAMLYAAEGAKRDGAVAVANTDPRMLRLFVQWLRRFFEIDEARLRVHLYLHDGLDLEAANSFWADTLGIPVAQFTKPYRAVADPSRRAAKHPMGCPSVGYRCSKTHRAIMGLVDALLP